MADAATKQRGKQRRYAGAAWSAPGPKGGMWANLHLDRAAARDTRRGGYIAQTLWVATNNGTVAYGKNVKAPYLQVSISRGYRKKGGNHMVVASRDLKGRYFEGRIPGPKIEFGKKYQFSIAFRYGPGMDDPSWDVGLGALIIASAKTMGKRPGSQSAYAGLESTSGRNTAAGRISRLARYEVTGYGGHTFEEWNLGGENYRSRLIRRGAGGSARWEKRDYELVNSLGQP